MLFISSTNKEFQNLKLSDLQVLATLGVGGFGRVELVQVNNDTTRSFALKQMKKSQVSTTDYLYQRQTFFVFVINIFNYCYWLLNQNQFLKLNIKNYQIIKTVVKSKFITLQKQNKI